MVEWGMVLRTSAIDRLIYEALQSGIDTVLNLGGGARYSTLSHEAASDPAMD